MEIYVGTSGWAYPWNEGGNLAWYAMHSGLNAVELNASFYRFPYGNQIRGWARQGEKLRFAVKIHRAVSHRHRLQGESLAIWKRFSELFQPLDPFVDFYLLQLPPSFRDLSLCAAFARSLNLGERLAIEFRNRELLEHGDFSELEALKATIVSTDSPLQPLWLRGGRRLYLRMHGRGSWYQYRYSLKELREVAEAVKRLQPERLYVFFNNDEAMLENARTLLKLLRKGKGRAGKSRV